MREISNDQDLVQMLATGVSTEATTATAHDPSLFPTIHIIQVFDSTVLIAKQSK